MASIVKRASHYYVIYNYINEQGERKQKWESGFTYPEALKRKAKIEYQKSKNCFKSPSDITVSTFFEKWIPIHAKTNWQFNTYSVSSSCIRIHVLPSIGEKRIQSITPFQIEELISILFEKENPNHKKGETARCISSTTVRLIYVLLRQMFNKAVEWGYIDESPVKCKPPRVSGYRQNIWSPEAFIVALEHIQNPSLHLAVHLAFVCSLRIGEILAITLDDINLEARCISITKTLQRVDKKALELLPHRSVFKIYPSRLAKSNSTLIVKAPKTDSSCRKVYLPQLLCEEIQARMNQMENEQRCYRWISNNLLFCHAETGGPIEPRLCHKWFKRWQHDHTDLGYPYIPFHAIRHSSATYKLLLSGGDYKTVQGDTGHKTVGVLLNTYAHIQESNRRNLTDKLERDFYSFK